MGEMSLKYVFCDFPSERLKGLPSDRASAPRRSNLRKFKLRVTAARKRKIKTSRSSLSTARLFFVVGDADLFEVMFVYRC